MYELKFKKTYLLYTSRMPGSVYCEGIDFGRFHSIIRRRLFSLRNSVTKAPLDHKSVYYVLSWLPYF